MRTLISLLAAFLFSSCISGNPDRFFGLGWQSHRSEVLDSLRAWRFTHNEEKARWEGGIVGGIQVNKLRIAFDSTDRLSFVEARHERLDHANSQAIFSHYLERTTRLQDQPEKDETASLEQIPVRRLTWDFTTGNESLRDMIILLQFSDVVLYQAGRNLPQPFEYAR